MTHPGIFFVRNPPDSAASDIKNGPEAIRGFGAAFRLIPKREPGSISLFSAQPDDRSGQRAHAEDCQHSPERRAAGVAVCGVDATVPAPPACCAAMMLKPAVTCPFS